VPEPSCILVGGPTASGKSACAVELASNIDGEIVNIDSVQCYQEVFIGAAKPSNEERSQVKHHLFDIFKPDVQIDVSQFSGMVRETVAEIRGRQKVPILVGSSGMYVSVLYSGIADIPTASQELRCEIRTLSTENLYAELKLLDQQRSLELHPSDRQRIERAVEICRVTGGTVKEAYRKHLPPFVRGPLFVLTPSPEHSAERIAIRTRQMMQEGLIEETEKVLTRWGDKVPPLQTIGYRQVVEHLQRKDGIDKEELTREIVIKTRQYAKRQRTFWRNEPSKRGWSTEILLQGDRLTTAAGTIYAVLERGEDLFDDTSVYYLPTGNQGD
jgi:tRNA dimethylallyltransferase